MRIVNKSKYVQIDWTVGNTCNYNCAYCPSNSKDGSWAWPDIDTSRAFVETLVQTYANKKLNFILLGGEVTLWKQFIPFVEMLRNTAQECKIKLLTNGIMPAWYWEQHGAKFDTVQFSFHTDADVNRFVDNVNSSTAPVNKVFVMIDPADYSNSVQNYRTIVERAHVASSIEGRMLDNRAGANYAYTQAQIDEIKTLVQFNRKGTGDLQLYEINNGVETRIENPMKYIHNNQNFWQGWQCYIGIEKLTLRENGDVTRGSSCRVGGVVGNWRNNELDLNNFSPVTCTVKQCMCGADIVISRHQ